MATSGFTNAIQYATGEVISLDTLSKIQRKKQYSAAAVAGIAVPKRFFSMLRAHGLEVVGIPLPDHYDYDKNPFKDINADLIFITEKMRLSVGSTKTLKETLESTSCL